jgi:hypothetical protein
VEPAAKSSSSERRDAPGGRDRAAEICDAVADGRTDEGVLATDRGGRGAAYDSTWTRPCAWSSEILID